MLFEHLIIWFQNCTWNYSFFSTYGWYGLEIFIHVQLKCLYNSLSTYKRSRTIFLTAFILCLNYIKPKSFSRLKRIHSIKCNFVIFLCDDYTWHSGKGIKENNMISITSCFYHVMLYMIHLTQFTLKKRIPGTDTN